MSITLTTVIPTALVPRAKAALANKLRIPPSDVTEAMFNQWVKEELNRLDAINERQLIAIEHSNKYISMF